MCYLPEWDMVKYNNKYTHNITGDINGMLTGSKLGGPAQRPSFFLSLSQGNVVRANVTSRKRHSTIWKEHLCAQKRSASLTA